MQLLQNPHASSAELWLYAETCQHLCVYWGRPPRGFLSSPVPSYTHSKWTLNGVKMQYPIWPLRGAFRHVDDTSLFAVLQLHASVIFKSHTCGQFGYIRRNATTLAFQLWIQSAIVSGAVKSIFMMLLMSLREYIWWDNHTLTSAQCPRHFMWQ